MRELLRATDKIGRHFQYWEAVRSSTAARLGIENTPSAGELTNIKRICADLMDPLRDHFGTIRVNSWFRSPELNHKIPGSSANSYHQDGCAVDFVAVSAGLRDVVDYVAQSCLPFDKIILEYGSWIHIQVPKTTTAPARRQVLQKFAGSPYEAYREAA